VCGAIGWFLASLIRLVTVYGLIFNLCVLSEGVFFCTDICALKMHGITACDNDDDDDDDEV
jgi:hypothetical protein